MQVVHALQAVLMFVCPLTTHLRTMATMFFPLFCIGFVHTSKPF